MLINGKKQKKKKNSSKFDSDKLDDASEVTSETIMSLDEELRFNELQAFIVLTKGFCVINFLMLPRIVSYSGWLVGLITLLIASIFVGINATKLVYSAIKTGEFTY